MKPDPIHRILARIKPMSPFKKDPSARAEEAALLETYLAALGMEM